MVRLRPSVEPVRPAAAAPPSVSNGRPGTGTPAPALVTLQLSAEPTSAELILDGAKLEGNPFSGQLPRDASLHRLEVRAPGRKSEARMVRLDQDLTLHVELSWLNAAAAPASVSAKTPAARRDGGSNPSSPADDFVHKQRDAKPARPIDNTDPYGP
jgi:hypothetical protein